MLQGEEIAFNGLELCSYKHLQGMAKNMGLPSNVKKVHLIEMIRAKKYCTESDLQAIVDRVKIERKVKAQAKKKKPQRKPYGLQGFSQSPPIMPTPKRPSDFKIQYTPDITQTIMKYKPKQNLLCSETSILHPLKRHIESDQVLRSFNSAKRPNYRITKQNDFIDVVACSSMEEIQEVRQEHVYQSDSVTVQKHRPVVTATVIMNQDRQLVPVNTSCAQDKPVYEYVPIVGFRRTDGRVTKINAVIQKPLETTLLPKNRTIKISKKSLIPRKQLVFKQTQALVTKRTLTVQDVINYKVDHQSLVTKDRESNMYQANEINRQVNNEKWNEQAIENLDSEVSYVSQTEMYSQARNINGQSLDKTDNNKINQVNTNEPISTNYRETQGRITDPISRDYQVEYQKFNQEIAVRNIRNSDHFDQNTRNIDPRSNVKNVYGQGILDKNMNYRSDHSTDRNNDNTLGIDQQMPSRQVNDRSTQDQYNVPNCRICNQRFNQDKIDHTSDRNRSEIQNKVLIDNRIHANAKERYVIDLTDRNRSIDTNRSDQRSDQRLSDQRHSDQRLSDQRPIDQSDISSQYPNMSALTHVFPNDYTKSKESNHSVYYHKKIRAEHMKCQKVKEQLPGITYVFSQFNDVQYRNLTQPLYVHVSAESERVPTKQPVNINSTCMLETIYNFKNELVTNPPLLMIANTQTHCTYSTKTISTAVAQPSVPELCNNSYERVNSYQGVSTSRVCDSLKPQLRPTTDFGCDEVLSSSTKSLETPNCQEIGANVTIPEIVEDGLKQAFTLLDDLGANVTIPEMSQDGLKQAFTLLDDLGDNVTIPEMSQDGLKQAFTLLDDLGANVTIPEMSQDGLKQAFTLLDDLGANVTIPEMSQDGLKQAFTLLDDLGANVTIPEMSQDGLKQAFTLLDDLGDNVTIPEMSQDGLKQAFTLLDDLGDNVTIPEMSQDGLKQAFTLLDDLGANVTIPEMSQDGLKQAFTLLDDLGANVTIPEMSQDGLKQAFTLLDDLGANVTIPEMSQDGLKQAFTLLDDLGANVTIPEMNQDGLKQAFTLLDDLGANVTIPEMGQDGLKQAFTLLDDLGANVTIPEMVQDALELISQDGDYMERIGINVRGQCIICDWAGPKKILEYHIKKYHANKIVQSIDTQCIIVCPIGSLSSTWSGQVLCYGPALYVLSGQATGYTVQLALSIIPTETEVETKRARITVFNTITGQPFSYESEIKEIPDTMPYEYGQDCLKLDISQLDVISADSLVREVNGSPTQTELNNVEIVVYVKFLD